ncbi:trans-aconitate 2-methyltransferase [Jiangella sp. DSM 45060]|uniref:class I SAM-dependent methyltransferase n=1 Tax=Jiangella sp. DSM 45060 TaxID=1798224 RepID=UPI00087B4269|nr:class I SAM-dependent methyltransferase [Jiangella sp. DSM 45060]SDT56682.1 Methyltransferase domain-containing protein [Jiangella sp. DSM 45060]
MTEEYRFYGDLAAWWPLISPPDDYADEAAVIASALESADLPVRDVLELGSGGGHNAVHLKRRFTLTLADLSPRMLAVSRELNPECEHVEGDMRDLRLGRAFDAVFVHDAVGYLLTEEDLAATVATAFAHCRPGGAAVFVPDHTTETFAERTEHGGGDGDDGRGARFLGWTWDPDPGDTWVRTEYVLLLREKDGSTETVHETHRIGLFGRDVWHRLLAAAGFEPMVLTRRDGPDDEPRDLLIGHRPG